MVYLHLRMVWVQHRDNLSEMQQAEGRGDSKERLLSRDQATFEIRGDVQVVRELGCPRWSPRLPVEGAAPAGVMHPACQLVME